MDAAFDKWGNWGRGVPLVVNDGDGSEPRSDAFLLTTLYLFSSSLTIFELTHVDVSSLSLNQSKPEMELF